jgi:DNA primase
MITESTLNDIRTRTDIVETISEYVQLKKSGQGFVGLCPFHGEKTPSFHVNPVRQAFHCFGCQKGGNIFTFICGIEGLSFPEAVKRLAKKAGVEVVEDKHYSRSAQPAVPKLDTRLTDAMEWAAKYFNYLLNQKGEYSFAAKYLESRGITKKTIEKFKLGVSPKGWTTLQDLMLRRGYSFEELVRAGLVIPKENSPTQGYDRFRQRLMFPISNAEGQIIGFGARLLTPEDKQPKYINSPEGPLFSKRKQLYGLYENQRGIRVQGEAVIVEGYMDVVGLYECNIVNAVATMGTALTEEHCFQLKGMTQRVVTVFDPDAGGIEAWHRSVHLFLSTGLFAKDLSLPDNKDPDEFVLSEGAEAFQKLCDKAPRQVTKLLKEIASRGPLSEQESAKILSDLTPVLVASKRLPDRAILWDDIALVTKVSQNALKELSEGAMAAGRAKTQRIEEPKIQKPLPKKPAQRLDALDFEFFQTIIYLPSEFMRLPKETWSGALREETIQTWLEKLYNSGTVTAFETVLEELVQTAEADTKLLEAASARLVATEPSVPSVDEMNFLAGRINARKKEKEIRALSAQVKLTQRLGDQEEQMKLLEKLRELRSSIKV